MRTRSNFEYTLPAWKRLPPRRLSCTALDLVLPIHAGNKNLNTRRKMQRVARMIQRVSHNEAIQSQRDFISDWQAAHPTTDEEQAAYKAMLEEAEAEIVAGRKGGEGWLDMKLSEEKYCPGDYEHWLAEYFWVGKPQAPPMKWTKKDHKKFIKKRYPNGYPHIQQLEAEKKRGSILERRRRRALRLRRKGKY